GFGPREAPAQRLSRMLDSIRPNTNVDTVPIEVFDRVKGLMAIRGISQRRMAALRGTSYGGAAHFAFAPSRGVLAEYARILDDEALQDCAPSDLFCDRFAEITHVGQREVFALTVPRHASWLACGVV